MNDSQKEIEARINLFENNINSVEFWINNWFKIIKSRYQYDQKAIEEGKIIPRGNDHALGISLGSNGSLYYNFKELLNCISKVSGLKERTIGFCNIIESKLFYIIRKGGLYNQFFDNRLEHGSQLNRKDITSLEENLENIKNRIITLLEEVKGEINNIRMVIKIV